MKPLSIMFLALVLSVASFAQTVTISVDISQNRKDVSPSIYGKNNSLSDNQSMPLSAVEWQRLKDAGIKFFRENSGNNATKYNWRLKLTSAPDWYNNVYGANWDFEAQSLQQHIPGAKGMYAFQLIGKAASNDNNNFNDWGYDGAQGGNNTSNWAGGGGPEWIGGNGGEGDPDLYLKSWPADSTVAILDKWFSVGADNLNLDESTFEYWNMDNEPEIWEDTHDDVMPHQLSAEAFMQRYFEVAKKARTKFPDIKLVGFVPCSEWYWYAYPDGLGNSGKISYNGHEYTWVEFFIKRIADEEIASGIRLLDVIDLHTYYDVTSEDGLLQGHRIFYDRNYYYPNANGVKLTSPDGWDESITQEYIFGRINDWLTQYMGAGHGVTIGSTESGWGDFNQMPLALNYASTLGVFANEGVELFAPWFWSPSYWEVVHLFSRYSKNISVQSTSGDDNYVSAYSTVNAANDSLTIVLVNRYPYAKNAQVTLSNFDVTDGLYDAYMLNNLPEDNSTETFASHSDNALKPIYAVVVNNVFNMALPAYSITSVVLKTGAPDSDYLGVTPAVIEQGDTAGSTVITIYSNVSWNVNCDQTWVHLSATSGTHQGSITATVEATTGTDTRTATITFTSSGVAAQTVTVTQTAPQQHFSQDLIIYNDNETLIETTWEDAGTLDEINTGAFEGSKHYRFNYTLSNWWSGYGLNFNNWAGEGTGYDFAAYESLKLACRLTGPASVTIGLVDANASDATELVSIDGAGGIYQEFTIPLSSFTGISLNDVGEILININGAGAIGTGTFDIDNIRLDVGASSTGINQIVKQTTKSALRNYPNPFNSSTIIEFETPGNGHYSLKIYDITGKEIAILLNEQLIAGRHTVRWDGHEASCGVYIIQLLGENGTLVTNEIVKTK